ncbi:MAG: nucleotidyltransferase family protein [Trueperaceae bacterium]
MTREDVLTALREHREELARMHMRSLALFGSVARDQAALDSDVDLLVEFSKPVGLFEFLDLKERLEQILGRPVDLVTREALKPQLKDRILSEAVRAA